MSPTPAKRAVANPAAPARLRVGFILANHFTLTAFSTFVDTLRLAADEGDGSRQILCNWTVMSASGHPVRSSCGIEVLPQAGLSNPAKFDYIAVIGGLLHKGPQIDATTESYLREAAAAGVPLIGVCTGSFVLARARLMSGRRCCVSWYHHRDLIDEFGDIEPISDRIFLVDGDRITCSGGAGAADLAAMLVSRHVGEQSARKSLNVLLFDAPRPASSTQPAPPYVLQGASERVRRASLLMEQSLAEPLAIEAIARRLVMSARQLDRLFQAELGVGPAAVYRAMRVEHGRWMLQGTTRPIADVASLTGFADSAHFSRAFRKQFGMTPSQWRQRLAQGPTELVPSDDTASSERRIF
ncbi:GlxA family transcriptional regulator [Devosia sp.]|uniref:GlxA family transcriptional regulator n=1 Tax=Devosia sp. TaxID=1871048 RepID=UPI00326687C0